MNFNSRQASIDDNTVIGSAVIELRVGSGLWTHRLYAALTGDVNDWCECDVVIYSKNGTTGSLPLKMFAAAVANQEPNDSAFAASDQPPAAPNTLTIRMNYTGETLYLFPLYLTEQITKVALVVRARSIAVPFVNAYLGILSEARP